MENLSVTLACLGNISVMSNPGTLVRIGFQMPRYSLGASGFMSYRSMWLGPPSSQIRMTEVFFVPAVFVPASSRAQGLRQAERGQAGDADLQEAAAIHAVAIAASAAEVQTKHDSCPPVGVVSGRCRVNGSGGMGERRYSNMSGGGR